MTRSAAVLTLTAVISRYSEAFTAIPTSISAGQPAYSHRTPWLAVGLAMVLIGLRLAWTRRHTIGTHR